MKGRTVSVVVIEDNIVESIQTFAEKEVHRAESYFLSQCKRHFSNFDEYSSDDILTILENGYEKGNNKGVCLCWSE